MTSILSSKWHKYFFDIAARTAQLSKDPSSQVGAAIANGKELVSAGFNGFPPNFTDDPYRYKDKEFKHKFVLHAESNAIDFADRHKLKGASIYIVPFYMCTRCVSRILASGISEVHVLESASRTYEPGPEYLTLGGVSLITHDYNPYE
jgi:dCMP deaminase